MTVNGIDNTLGRHVIQGINQRLIAVIFGHHRGLLLAFVPGTAMGELHLFRVHMTVEAVETVHRDVGLDAVGLA